MQTFLSENTFRDSARALDSKRLNKQLLECRQIATALAGMSKGWRNHPATKMWEGYEYSLFAYGAAVVLECANRGISYDKNWDAMLETQDFFAVNAADPPWWTGPERLKVVTTHRASLYHKDNDYYSQYKPDADTVDRDVLSWVCCPTRRAGSPCGYYWPTH